MQRELHCFLSHRSFTGTYSQHLSQALVQPSERDQSGAAAFKTNSSNVRWEKGTVTCSIDFFQSELLQRLNSDAQMSVSTRQRALAEPTSMKMKPGIMNTC
jgi:hypothetical protein